MVDDHSSDHTAELAREAGAEVIQAPPLPSGWTGKLWASHNGVQAALTQSPDFILLTDADITHHPETLSGLAARALTGPYDLVSYMAKLRCESPAERFLIPAFVYFFFQLYPPKYAQGAAGGCILIRTRTLLNLGGIESIKGELIDDCALARHAKQSGAKLWLGLTEQSISIRPYITWHEVRRMISRTAYTQLQYNPIILLGTILGLVITYLIPPLALTPISLFAYLLMTITFLPILRFYKQPYWMAPLLPLIALYYTYATLESAYLYHTNRGGQWKGRSQAN